MYRSQYHKYCISDCDKTKILKLLSILHLSAPNHLIKTIAPKHMYGDLNCNFILDIATSKSSYSMIVVSYCPTKEMVQGNLFQTYCNTLMGITSEQ